MPPRKRAPLQPIDANIPVQKKQNTKNDKKELKKKVVLTSSSDNESSSSLSEDTPVAPRPMLKTAGKKRQKANEADDKDTKRGRKRILASITGQSPDTLRVLLHILLLDSDHWYFQLGIPRKSRAAAQILWGNRRLWTAHGRRVLKLHLFTFYLLFNSLWFYIFIF